MAVKIRLARRGAKKRPFYHIVVADARNPRDGRYIERIGTYNPMLAKDSDERVNLNAERAKYWLDNGAQPTDRVARFLAAAELMAKREKNNPKKALPGKKAQERIEEARMKAEEAAAAAADADNAEEAAAEE